MKTNYLKNYLTLFLVFVVLGFFVPKWALYLMTVSLNYGIIVLGMLLLARTGLVSFGHGLYYCLGAYAAGTLKPLFGINEISIMLLSSIFIPFILATLLGFLLRRYRDIFFAMLSLAFSMILYGLLVKTSSLGSTDGFNVDAHTLLGFTLSNSPFERYIIFLLSLFFASICIFLMIKYLKSSRGMLAEAIRDNELRVEYIGASVKSTIHINYVISAVFAGLAGGLTAITVGHIDPEMSYWTTSGEFVFITILSGTGSVFAPFVGAAIFETIRSFAYELSPNTWQMSLGLVMLIVIMFLPEGIWSLLKKRNKK